MTITEVSRALNKEIARLSEMSPDELLDFLSVIERTHVHIMIERHLRERVSPRQAYLRSVT